MNSLLDLPKTNNKNNKIFNQNNGWTDNNRHLSVTDYKCMCSACMQGLLLSETPENITTSSTSSSTDISDNPPIEALLSGRKWYLGTDRKLTYSFYEDDVFNGNYYGSEEGIKEVSQAVKDNVRNVFAWLETIIDVDFVEVQETNTSTFGKIRFMDSNTPAYAYAYYPSSSSLGGDVFFNANYDRLGDHNGFQHLAGKHGYMSIIHEIGHALGLQHTHSGNLDSALDNTDSSVMTYNFTGKSAGTAMPLDIAALQSLYGAKQHNTGDTIYTFDGYIDRLMVNGNLVLDTSYRTKQSFWDSAGIDTLDFSGLNYASNGYELDINFGGLLSKTFNGTTDHSTAIAYEVEIENIINSGSNDKIYLNNIGNVIGGYASNKVTGHDVIYNGNSLDTLELAYTFQEVTQTQEGNHLILGLGDNGSIKLVDYYANNDQIKIIYDDQVIEGDGDSDSNATELTLTLNNTISTATVESYTDNQDINSSVTIENDELQIVGNGWKKIAVNYDITSNTMLKFDFQSTAQGEIHAIGFDIDNSLNSDTHFNLYGTQDWQEDIEDFKNYSGDGSWQSYLIDVGTYFTGQYNYLTFANDHDVENPNAMSRFRNIQLYEGLKFTVNGQQQASAIESYGGDQDQNPTVTLNNQSVEIVGNGWKKIALDYNITSNTRLKFDFQSTAQGEIHAIGFDDDNSLSSNTHFNLYGSQDWKEDIEAFKNYSGDGNWQSYVIDVGSYFTGQYNYLTFANDHDIDNPDAISRFRNIQLYEETTTASNSALNTQVSSDNNTQELLSQILENTNSNITGSEQNTSLVGTPDADLFILGDETQVYYQEKGYKDFALIEGFNSQQGDVIELHDDASFYDVVSFNDKNYQGSAIFYTADNNDDLIGIVSDVSTLNLDSNAINFA